MKVVVLLSGGVDSSVAMNLAKQQGATEIIAYYLKIWLEEDLAFLGECPWEEDLGYARKACEQAGVPLEIINLQKQYFDRVVDHAINELKNGRTPSPDILCNQRVKFGAFIDYIDDSFDKIVSGHYAQVEEKGGQFYLKRSPDPVKDQTYFLAYLNQQQLSRIWFPIGGYLKDDVRDLAEEFDLPNKSRKDSQGICFLGKIKYPDFVKSYLGEKQGDIIELETGNVLGKHNGFWFHTIGQRQGLGLHGGPWYVVQKDCDKNIVYVSHKDNYKQQSTKEFTVANVNWITGQPDKTRLTCKLRHGPKLEPCTIELLETNVRVVLDGEDSGVAPGQYTIFYDGEYCLGGGIIE